MKIVICKNGPMIEYGTLFQLLYAEIVSFHLGIKVQLATSDYVHALGFFSIGKDYGLIGEEFQFEAVQNLMEKLHAHVNWIQIGYPRQRPHHESLEGLVVFVHEFQQAFFIRWELIGEVLVMCTCDLGHGIVIPGDDRGCPPASEHYADFTEVVTFYQELFSNQYLSILVPQINRAVTRRDIVNNF